MGLVVLHLGHASKIFSKLLGTPTGQLKWREADEKERIWVVDPAHPITAGIGEYIELPEEEMYGEHFNISTPDGLVFVSWFEGGEVFRSGVTYHRGRGKIFYPTGARNVSDLPQQVNSTSDCERRTVGCAERYGSTGLRQRRPVGIHQGEKFGDKKQEIK